MKKIFSIVLLAVGATIVHAQSFLIIGDSAFYANGISPDGKYVVGQIEKGSIVGGHHTFVWAEEDGAQHWDEDKANHFQEGSTARAVSPTGRIIGAAPDSHIVTVERPLAISARKVNGDETVRINWSDPYGNVSLRYLLFDNATDCLTVNGIRLTKDENGFSIYPNPLRQGESITIEY